jgi:hypothetical protein
MARYHQLSRGGHQPRRGLKASAPRAGWSPTTRASVWVTGDRVRHRRSGSQHAPLLYADEDTGAPHSADKAPDPLAASSGTLCRSHPSAEGIFASTASPRCASYGMSRRLGATGGPIGLTLFHSASHRWCSSHDTTERYPPVLLRLQPLLRDVPCWPGARGVSRSQRTRAWKAGRSHGRAAR